MNQVRLWQALGRSGGADARIVTWKSTCARQQGRMSSDRAIWWRAHDPKDDVKNERLMTLPSGGDLRSERF